MDWPRIDTSKVTEELVAAAADLEAFRVVVAGYFEQFSNPPYKRRPNLGLRLSGDSCIIGVRPVWSKSKMQLDCGAAAE